MAKNIIKHRLRKISTTILFCYFYGEAKQDLINGAVYADGWPAPGSFVFFSNTLWVMCMWACFFIPKSWSSMEAICNIRSRSLFSLL